MPTYEYQCSKGHRFEVFQKISDKPRAKCPTCGLRASRIITGGAGLIFKGSGFYITDYGKDGKGPRKTDAAPDAAPAADKPAASAEAAPSGESSTKPAKKAGKAAK
jgi:putative FmdB family regulatory protein